jgi:hypothetical protein
MALRTFAVTVEDPESGEATAFRVEASSTLIACTRAANRLFGPEAEVRRVYACAACGEPLWEEEILDSSGYRFCTECDPAELEDFAEQEPIGLEVGGARVSAVELALLPGDAPIGALTVVGAAPGAPLVAGDVLGEDEVRAVLERAVRLDAEAERTIGGLAVRDEEGAFFRYELHARPEAADPEELVARGMLKQSDLDALRAEEGEEEEDELDDDEDGEELAFDEDGEADDEDGEDEEEDGDEDDEETR